MKLLIQGVLRTMGYEVKRLHPAEPMSNIDLFRMIAETLSRDQKNVFFVQVGANDGVQSDPINHFVSEYGWRGILVEPQPAIFKKLKK